MSGWPPLFFFFFLFLFSRHSFFNNFRAIICTAFETKSAGGGIGRPMHEGGGDGERENERDREREGERESEKGGFHASYAMATRTTTVHATPSGREGVRENSIWLFGLIRPCGIYRVSVLSLAAGQPTLAAPRGRQTLPSWLGNRNQNSSRPAERYNTRGDSFTPRRA